MKVLSDRDPCASLPVIGSGAPFLYRDHAITFLPLPTPSPSHPRDSVVLCSKTFHAPKKQTPVFSGSMLTLVSTRWTSGYRRRPNNSEAGRQACSGPLRSRLTLMPVNTSLLHQSRDRLSLAASSPAFARAGPGPNSLLGVPLPLAPSTLTHTHCSLIDQPADSQQVYDFENQTFL